MNKLKMPLKQFKFILILLILVFVFLFLSYTVSRAYINKVSFENDVISIASKNDEIIFTIDNITLFSSANASSEIQSNSALKLNNLYQFTDMALFISPGTNNLTNKNTLKQVFINNINFAKTPDEGTPNLYYKNIQNFATPGYDEEKRIEDILHFEISSENDVDLSKPILYNNCANPITLSFVNNNIKTDYTLADAFSQITYDGSLLKRCGITLNSIASGVSFDIHIINNLEQEFICPIYIEIPLEAEDSTSIYDGKVLLKNNTNYTFYRCN